MARGGKGRSGRRYVRDAKGRFASKGAGATARGGRLKTASGKKRATQTMKVSGAKTAGTIGKPKGLKPGTIKAKPKTSSARQAAKSKPASQPKVTRKGGRIDPARQADRASTAKVNKALSAEKAARTALFSSKEAFSSPKRQELTRKLNEATYKTAAEIQTRRNVRASFPVMRKTPTVKASRPSSTIKAPTSTKAQRNRASKNLTRSLDSRGRAIGTKNRRTKRAAERAAQFYSNPIEALKSVTKKGTGFKLPRSMRRAAKNAERKAAQQAAQAKPAPPNLGKPAQVTSRGRTIKPAENFKPAVKGKSAPDNARTRANKLKTAQNRVKMYSETDSRSAQNAIANRNAALKARPQGTPGNVVFRSRSRASSRFQQRANDLTTRIKSDLKHSKPGTFSATGGGGGKGIVRRNTGDKQTSLFGKPASLYTNKTTKSVKRRSGKRK